MYENHFFEVWTAKETFLKGMNCFGVMQWYVTELYLSRKHVLKLSCETFPKVYRIFVFMFFFVGHFSKEDIVFYIVIVLFFVKSLKSPFHAFVCEHCPLRKECSF